MCTAPTIGYATMLSEVICRLLMFQGVRTLPISSRSPLEGSSSQSSVRCLGCVVDRAFCLGSVLFLWQFGLRVCVLYCVVSVACLFCLCLLGGRPLLGQGGRVGAPVASFRCSCLVFPLYLIFTCYIARYLCVGQEEGRASRFFLLLTCTRYVLYNTFLPPLDLH